MKPYFVLEQMVGAAFDCARRLFGLGFAARPDLETACATELSGAKRRINRRRHEVNEAGRGLPDRLR